MGEKVSAARADTVGGGGCCAANTEVSKNSDVGRSEMTVVPGRTVVRHSSSSSSRDRGKTVVV